ncbi:MAG: hypothetical protein ABI592_07670 [Acidobacteriota bacterium]
MNGSDRRSVSSRVFLYLGGLVVAVVAIRFVRATLGAVAVFRGIRRDGEGGVPPAAPSATAVALVVALLFAILAIAAGVVRRRRWARGAAIALLAATAAAGLVLALIQLSALARGVDRSPEAAEIGYGPVLSYWRIAAIAVGLLAALFSGASLRRLASPEMRRQFDGSPAKSPDGT